MRKQFLKITQLAKENLVGAERTDTLAAEQVETEKRVKAVRGSLDDVNHHVGSCITGSSSDMEKRQKALPLYKLGTSMEKAGDQLGVETILGLVMKEGSECEKGLAGSVSEFELNVDKVAKQLKSHLKTGGQALDAERERLSSYRLSMDVVAGQLSQAQKSGNSEKIPSLQLELTKATEDFHQFRTTYSERMRIFLDQEKHLASLVVQFMRLQADHYRECLHVLEEKVTAFESRLGVMPPKPLFGNDLQEHLTSSGRKIAKVIEECVNCLSARALNTEGLFRLAGSSSEIKKLKTAFNNGLASCDDCPDDHVVADCLKQYLRELPDPLLTYAMFDEWKKAVSIQNEKERQVAIASCTQGLPPGNYDNLIFLMKFLYELSQHEEVTKMSARNIGLVLGPNLLWSRESLELGSSSTFTDTPLMTKLAEEMVQHFPVIFGNSTVQSPTATSTNGTREAPSSPVAMPRRRRPPPVPVGRAPSTPPSPSTMPPLQRTLSSDKERRPAPPVPGSKVATVSTLPRGSSMSS